MYTKLIRKIVAITQKISGHCGGNGSGMGHCN
jgi:hypothetical protein